MYIIVFLAIQFLKSGDIRPQVMLNIFMYYTTPQIVLYYTAPQFVLYYTPPQYVLFVADLDLQCF